jgi:hypothetical protein
VFLQLNTSYDAGSSHYVGLYNQAVVAGAAAYFRQKFGPIDGCNGLGDVSHLVKFYQVARCCHPRHAKELRLTAPDIDTMRLHVPWLSNSLAPRTQLIIDLKAQLPQYLAACDGFVTRARAAAVDAGTLVPSGPTSGARTVMTAATADLDRLQVWWSEWAVNPACEFPAWVELARDLCTVGPSSAAAERVFSTMRRTFGDFQHGALEDYLETSLMLQTNEY